MDKVKVSFDFDDTLSTKAMQEVAKVLIELGFEVWIVTSRRHQGGGWVYHSNLDLFEVAEKVGILPEHIVFTQLEPKFTFIKDEDFAYHFDDCPTEIEEINKFTNTKGILIR